MVSAQLDIQKQKNEVEFFISEIEVNYESINLNVNPHYIGLSNDFLYVTHKHKRQKKKIGKLDNSKI